MNRFEGIHPTWSGWDLTLTLEEKMHLQSLANSPSMLDRYLCILHLNQNCEVEGNSRFILKICDLLIPDEFDRVSSWALMLLGDFFRQEIHLRKSIERERSDGRKRAEKELKQRLAKYDEWDPVKQSWPVIRKYCSSRNPELRRDAGVFLLEHLLDDWFETYFPMIEREICRENRALLDVLHHCWFNMDKMEIENLDRVDTLLAAHLKGKRLRKWKSYYQVARGTYKPVSSRKTPRLRPLKGNNRLWGHDDFDLSDVSRLNSEEKDYLRLLATGRKRKDRIRALKLLDHWGRVTQNKSLFFSTVDLLLADKDLGVRSFAAFTLAEHGEINPKRMFDLIVKHGSSPSPHTQRMIALGPLGLIPGFFDHDQQNRFEMLLEALAKGNQNFARTVSQILLWPMEPEYFDRLDCLISKQLTGKELTLWKLRASRHRPDMKEYLAERASLQCGVS